MSGVGSNPSFDVDGIPQPRTDLDAISQSGTDRVFELIMGGGVNDTYSDESR